MKEAVDKAAEGLDPALLILGVLVGVVAVLVAAVVLRAAWVHLRPQLAEILGPAARNAGATWTRKVHGGEGPGTPWLCVPCRSYNEGRNHHCYKCGAARADVEGPPPAIN